MTLKLTHPFTAICSGPSGCGKSTFTIELIKRLKDLCTVSQFHRIVWCLSETSTIPTELSTLNNVIVHRGVPKFENKTGLPILYCVDDLMNEVYSRDLSELFTRKSHHESISCVLITQNLFFQNPSSRTVSLNCKILVVFKNPRDVKTICYLAQQIAGPNWREVQKVFTEATIRPYSYLLFDLTQECNDLIRYRTNIFDKYTVVYAPVNEHYAEIEI